MSWVHQRLEAGEHPLHLRTDWEGAVDRETKKNLASQVQHRANEARRKLHTALTGRSLAGLNIVAIFIDGTERGGETGLWALGVTKDGTKVPLHLVLGESETVELVQELFKGLDGRELDMRDAYIVIDGGSSLLATVGESAGRCRNHLRRNILDKLPKTHYKDGWLEKLVGKRRCAAWARTDGANPKKPDLEHLASWLEESGHTKSAAAIRTEASARQLHRAVRDRLDAAWSEPDYETAKGRLEELAEWLDAEGFPRAATSLRNGLEMSIALQRLRITPDHHELLKKSFGTNNPQESPHRAADRAAENITRYQGEMRERFLAHGIALAEKEWKPVATPAALEELTFAVMRDGHVLWAQLSRADTITVMSLPPAFSANASAHHHALWDVARWADRNGKTVEIPRGVLTRAEATEALEPWLEASGFAAVPAKTGVTYVRAPHEPGTMDWAKVPSMRFSVRRVAAAAGDAEAARTLAATSLGLGDTGDPSAAVAICRGSPDALRAYGLEAEEPVALSELAAAVRGRHAREERWVRATSPVQLRDADGAPAGRRVPGVVNVACTLEPHRKVVDRWRRSDSQRRLEIERALVASAEAALWQCVDVDHMAAAFVVEKRDARGSPPVVRVHVLVLGEADDAGAAKIRSPVSRSVFRNDKRRMIVEASAATAAMPVLEAQLARMGPERSLQRAVAPAAQRPSSRAGALAALGDRATWIDRQARRHQMLFADESLHQLRARRAEMGDPFAHLGHMETDAWMRTYRWEAVQLVACELELEDRERGLATDPVARLFERPGFREVLGGRRVEELIVEASARFEILRTDPRLRADPDAVRDKLLRRLDELRRNVETIDRGAAKLQLWVERQVLLKHLKHPEHEQLDEGKRRLEESGYPLSRWMADNGELAEEAIAIQALLSETELAHEVKTSEPTQMAAEVAVDTGLAGVGY